MKKFAFAAIVASVVATPAFAANNNSQNATIKATVPLVCEVTAPDGGTVSTSGTTAIGSGSVTCNDVHGFIATLSSANQGAMVSSDSANNSTIPYKVSIAGVTDGDGPQSLASDKTFPGPAYPTGASFPVSIVTTGVNGAAYAGTYKDVITFSIQAQ